MASAVPGPLPGSAGCTRLLQAQGQGFRDEGLSRGSQFPLRWAALGEGGAGVWCWDTQAAEAPQGPELQFSAHRSALGLVLLLSVSWSVDRLVILLPVSDLVSSSRPHVIMAP